MTWVQEGEFSSTRTMCVWLSHDNPYLKYSHIRQIKSVMVAGDIFFFVSGEAVGRQCKCYICADVIVPGGSQIRNHIGRSRGGSVSKLTICKGTGIRKAENLVAHGHIIYISLLFSYLIR